MQIVNKRTKTIIEIEKSGQSSRQRLYLITGGRAGLVAATGGDSAGVSQTDAGWPWAAAAAAWLVIHGVAAGMRRKSQWRLWDVRYTAIHSWVGMIVYWWREVGEAGGAMGGAAAECLP